jgi:hypothetical protein
MKTSRIALLAGIGLLAAGAVALPVLAQPGPPWVRPSPAPMATMTAR